MLRWVVRRIGGNQLGFTLIELMIVILVILILAAILIPQFGIARERSRKASCVSNQRNIETGVAMWAVDNLGTSFTNGAMNATSIPSMNQLTGNPQYVPSGAFSEPDDTGASGTNGTDYYLANGAATGAAAVSSNPSYGHVTCEYDGYTDPWAGGHDGAGGGGGAAINHTRGTSASP